VFDVRRPVPRPLDQPARRGITRAGQETHTGPRGPRSPRSPRSPRDTGGAST
jgi:hypothetical protein